MVWERSALRAMRPERTSSGIAARAYGGDTHGACDVDVAAVGRYCADEDRHKCALAESVLAKQADDLADADREVCAPGHRQFAPTRPHPSSTLLGDAFRHQSANFTAWCWHRG